MEDIIKLLKSDEVDRYRSIPFWSWNSRLEKSELARQIAQMQDAGIGGFVIHARSGLTTPYLSDEWFDCVGYCLDEAERRSMEVWIYDENGWPSGFVGGKLLKNPAFRARFLRYCVLDRFDPEALAVYALEEDGRARRLTEPEGCRAYHCVYLHTSPANTDILNPDVVSAFIAETHEQYYARFSERFGRTLKGFFTDEPQYYRYETPYSPAVQEAYRREYGEEVLDGLIYLFRSDEASRIFRYRYYGLMNRLYTENYYHRLYEWCSAHNCQLTGHSVEEPRLHTQMWGGAGVMPSYEFEHMPGIDWLGRAIDCETAPKQAASVAAQTGKQFVLTETFGCCGWDTTPMELKNIAQFQYIYGVNRMCQHLTSYSLAGQGKLDHPPSFSHHMFWWEDYRIFNDYFARLGCLIGSTREVCGVGVLHPMRDVWLHYDRALDAESVAELDERFLSLISDLTERSIPHQYLDESVLGHRGWVENGTLHVGDCAYEYVLIPHMEAIGCRTAELLEEFRASGGKLCVLGNSPRYLAGNVWRESKLASDLEYSRLCELNNYSPMEKPGQVIVNYRDQGDVILILNTGDPCQVRLNGLENNYCRLDLETCFSSAVACELNLERYELCVLIKGKSASVCATAGKKCTIELTDQFICVESDPNNLTLDCVSISYDGSHYLPEKYVYGVMEELIKAGYRGKLWLCYRFFCADKLDRLTLRAEKSAEPGIRVNGVSLPLRQSAFDPNFVEAEFVPRQGENRILRILNFHQPENLNFILYDPMSTESLRNCLVYGTEIEPVYVRGAFTVDEARSLHRADGFALGISAIERQGYPFFGGRIRFAAEIEYTGIGRAVLRLSGRYMTVQVDVNGSHAGTMVLNNALDLTCYLHKGRNRLELTVKSSLRNMLGPHHYGPDREPFAVSPFTFTLAGTWENGTSPLYESEYSIVPFGIDRVLLELDESKV